MPLRDNRELIADDVAPPMSNSFPLPSPSRSPAITECRPPPETVSPMPQSPAGSLKKGTGSAPPTPSQLTGIGVNLHRTSQGTFVIRGVQQGSVAQLSGKVASGHIVLAIDGESVQGKTLESVAALVQGPPKSSITLSLQHATGKYLVQLKRGNVSSASAGSTPRMESRSSESSDGKRTPRGKAPFEQRGGSARQLVRTPQAKLSPSFSLNLSTVAQPSSTRPAPPPFLHAVEQYTAGESPGEELASRKALFRDDQILDIDSDGIPFEGIRIWSAVQNLPLVMDDFRVEAVGEVNSIAVSVLGEQQGQHSAPLWAGDPDTSIVGYEAEGEVQSTAVARDSSTDGKGATVNESMDGDLVSGSYPHMYSLEVQGTPNIWRVLKASPLQNDDYRAAAAEELLTLATAAGVSSPLLDSQHASMKDSYVRQWIGGTLRAASISASPPRQPSAAQTDLSDGAKGGAGQQARTETRVANNVWTVVKSMPLYSDGCQGEELLLLGEKLLGAVSVPKIAPEDFIDENSLICPPASASTSTLQPRGQRFENSDSSAVPTETKRGQVWTTLARMPINMDDFHEGTVEELNQLSRIASPDRPAAVPAPTAQGRSPAGPRDERGKRGVWAAVTQLPLDLEGLEISGEETLLELSKDLDPIRTDSADQLPSESVLGDSRSADDGAVERRAAPCPRKSRSSRASPAETASDGAKTGGRTRQDGAQLTREMDGVSLERSEGPREKLDSASASGDDTVTRTARQDSGLPALSPVVPSLQSFPADISAISVQESPVAANDSSLTMTMSDDAV